VQFLFIERCICPGCNATGIRTLWDSTFDYASVGSFIRNYYDIDPAILAGRYRLNECRDCGLVFQAFVGDAMTLSTLYSSWAPTADDPNDITTYFVDMSDTKGSRDAHEILTASAFLRRPCNNLKVLDYGMGWGLWASIARKLGCDAYGTELSHKMIKNASANGVCVLPDNEIEVNRFDFINLEQVLEHVATPLALLRRLRDSLAPHGVLKISLPNASRAKRIIGLIGSGRYRGDYETIMPIQPLEHINGFSPAAVEVMVQAAGLRCVRPSIPARYAFLRQGGLPRTTARAVKELARPVWQFHNRRNIYRWLVRA
jgi:SAM-dependent methyltransferase